MEALIHSLQKKKIHFKVLQSSATSISFQLNIQAKPGAKKEAVKINDAGELILSIRERPVEGEANAGIIEKVAELFGIAKSRVNLVSGHKSRQKKIEIHLELNAGKNLQFYLNRIDALIT